MSEKSAPLYLSRLILDLNYRRVRSEIAHPYEMHRTLMHAFKRYTVNKEEKVREKCGVLFRTDVDDRNSRAIVYVQSIVEPDWSYLHDYENYLYCGDTIPNPVYKDVATSYRNLRDGQTLSFSLRANPTKRILKPAKGDEILKGKRVALLREEEQVAWLARKGSEREKGCPGGFEIISRKILDQGGEIRQLMQVNTTREGKQTGYKKGRNGERRRHRMTHFAVRFDGLLRITDSDAFRETLARGIGPAKAFGCGLLLVKRA